MGGIITIELGWPAPQLSPNSRAHHMEKWRFQKASKDTAYWVTREALGRDKFEAGDEIMVRVTAHPIKGKVRPDDDNLIASCKAFFDGIALALGVNDNLFRQQAIEWADPVPNGKLFVELR